MRLPLRLKQLAFRLKLHLNRFRFKYFFPDRPRAGEFCNSKIISVRKEPAPAAQPRAWLVFIRAGAEHNLKSTGRRDFDIALNAFEEPTGPCFEEADYDPEVFSHGKVVELTVDLFPTSWVFRKGHAIRLSVACTDRPTFPRHPLWNPKSPPTVQIHRGGPTPSRIDLPIMGD